MLAMQHGLAIANRRARGGGLGRRGESFAYRSFRALPKNITHEIEQATLSVPAARNMAICNLVRESNQSEVLNGATLAKRLFHDLRQLSTGIHSKLTLLQLNLKRPYCVRKIYIREELAVIVQVILVRIGQFWNSFEHVSY